MNAIGLIFLFLLFLISTYICLSRGVAKAFIYVFIPVIYLVISGVNVKIVEGLPRLTPGFFVLLPILISFIVNGCYITKFNFVDFSVIGFLFSAFLSNFFNSGYWDAQHNLFDDIWVVLLPYIFAKNLIHPLGFSFSLGKCIVVLAVILSVFGLIEFFTGKSLFIYIFWRFFPDQVMSSSAERFGFYRVAGTFVHPIVLCTVLGISFCINRWVQVMRGWKPQFFKNFMNFKSSFFSIVTFLGALTTLARGPLLGVGFGYVISGFYQVNSVKKSFFKLMLVFIAAFIAYKMFEIYTEVPLDEASDLQSSVIYRQRLFDLYYDLIAERPFFGWGTYLPTIQGYQSIDNGFIYEIMINGFVTLFVFLILLATVMIRLFFAGLNLKTTFDKRSLAFTLLGTLVVYLISFWTAALQTDFNCNSLLFSILGWSEGLLAFMKRDSKYVELKN